MTHPTPSSESAEMGRQMNGHLPGPLRDALNGSFLRPARIDADPSPIIAGRSSRESSNDEAAPRYMRAPEQDKRVSRGDSFNGNAWLDVQSGQVRLFNTGYDANAQQWSRAPEVTR